MLAIIDKRPSDDFPTIGVDLDDIVADFTASSLAVIEAVCGPNPEVCRARHFDYNVDVSFGQEAGNAVDEAMTTPEFWLSVPPMDGAVKSLMDLMQHYRIHIITSRPAHFKDLTKYWLAMYEIPFDDVTLVDNRAQKIDVARATGACAFVDDNQETAEAMRDAGLVVGQLAWPWNREAPGILRRESWPELSLALAQEIKLKNSDFKLF